MVDEPAWPGVQGAAAGPAWPDCICIIICTIALAHFTFVSATASLTASLEASPSAGSLPALSLAFSVGVGVSAWLLSGHLYVMCM